jgi:hypothetical protein
MMKSNSDSLAGVAAGRVAIATSIQVSSGKPSVRPAPARAPARPYGVTREGDARIHSKSGGQLFPVADDFASPEICLERIRGLSAWLRRLISEQGAGQAPTPDPCVVIEQPPAPPAVAEPIEQRPTDGRPAPRPS